jgi:Lrp/AsnC family transcriptional regulator for asnA, asnC and gidA
MPRSPATSSAPVLDGAAKAIIEQLQADGRRSYVDHGVVQIVAVTDPLQVGFARQAMIGIKASGDIELLADGLADVEGVDYVVITAGGFDLLVEVVCEDDDQLLEIVNRQIRSLPGVLTTETFVYLKLRKQLYNWGTR